MNNPTLTAICCTYARPACVNETVKMFLNQTWSGPKQLIVLNTFPKQDYRFTSPFRGAMPVTIVNLPERPKSLGDARNAAIELADEDSLIITWDDDDFYCSWHLANYGENLEPDCDWYWLSAEYFSENRRIKSVAMGTPNLFAFTKKAWRSVGGYPSLTVGEDRKFMAKVSAECKGKKVTLAVNRISFIRGWGADELYHTSGLGEDQSAHERVAGHAQSLIQRGLLKEGVIQIQPETVVDYDKLALDFAGAICRVQNNRHGRVGVMYLGRHGDILNVLPIAKAVYDRTGQKPIFFASTDFSDTLDGVSYIEKVVMELPYVKIKEAKQFAEHKCELLICPMVWGENFATEKRTHFNQDAWIEAGFSKEFGDKENYPLIIDQRDIVREKALCDTHLKTDKPVILVNVSCGTSSPYPPAKQFFDMVRANWQSRYDVVDLCPIRSERVYDLLGMYDRARLLITSDTATLHLAAASSIPVIALVNDENWLGTATRCNCIYRVRYSEAIPNLSIINMLIASIDQMPFPHPAIVNPAVHARVERKIIHAVERHNFLWRNERQDKAMASWESLYQQGVIAAHFWKYKRDARDIGDQRALPYLKDVLEHGMSMAGNDDIVCWTNDDNLLHPDLPRALRLFVDLFEAGTSQRRDFRVPYQDGLTPEQVVCASERHLGRDAFFATKRWLVEHWEEIPDFILGSPVFDLCLAAMVRKHRGFTTTRQNIEQVIPCCELTNGYVSHQHHDPVWNTLPLETPSIAHNARLFEQWAKKYAPEIRTPL